MPIPPHIVETRKKIGHDLMWLPGVTGIVVDEEERVLLVRRSDNLRWTLVTGCLDPGEQPAVGMLREIEEETAVVAVVERVLAVEATQQMQYPNGDLAVYLDVAFVCRPVSGSAKVNDDESVDVVWFPLTALPEGLPERHVACIKRYLDDDEAAWFARS